MVQTSKALIQNFHIPAFLQLLLRRKKMLSSRILLLGSFPFRTPKALPFQCFLTSKPLPLSSLRFRLHSSSAALDTVTAVGDADADTSNSTLQHHPWPEWVTFIDRLKTKGYFDGDNIANDVTVSSSDSVVYKDMNLVKDACLSFARDRYDIFKLLSTEDIQTLVGNGCPNLFRKAVNSAKRLRAHLRLDEGDVCSACNLRGSCDRAYVILKENEAAARTVDIVRILLFYALDPLVVAGGENEKPPGREIVDTSARKLFSELIKLSETAPDPSLPKPALKSSPKKEETISHRDDELSQNVDMKRGDWMCPKCNFMNFSRNIKCRRCNEDGPKNVGGVDVEMKKGDWICSACNFMNFARNIRCLNCKADGPKRVDVSDVEMKKGDWNCPQCGFMNFASNKKCLRCPESRPKRPLNPGEWECLSCDFLNYRRNRVCLKCNCERPKQGATEYEDQMWNRPRSNTFTGTH